MLVARTIYELVTAQQHPRPAVTSSDNEIIISHVDQWDNVPTRLTRLSSIQASGMWE